MDINSLASEFGTATSTDDHGRSEPGFDVHGLAAEFGSDKTAQDVAKLPPPERVRPVYIVKPPISGATPEESADINAQPDTKGGANPRDLLPKTSIQESAYEADKNAQGLLEKGISDFQQGRPYKALGEGALGVLGKVTSPVTGIVEGAVGTPVTDITGSPEIGNRAAFVAGGAMPVVPGASTVAKILPKNKALNTLVESIGQENLPRIVSKMEQNPRLTPADLSPKVLQDTQHLFVTDGPHINYLADQAKRSTETAKSAVESAMDTHLGGTVDAVQKLKELKQNIREVGQREIQPIIAAKPHTDITDVIHELDQDIGKPVLNAIRKGQNNPLVDDTKRALYDIRDKLRGSWPDRDQMFAYTDQLNEIQSKLRMKAETLKNSANGWERELSKKLFEYREKIKDAIGPEYKAALAKYKDEFDIQEAFHKGHDELLTNSKSMETRPEFFKDWVKKSSPEEINAAQEGARVAIDTQINGFKHAARRGTDVGEVEFNRQRIEALFGKKEADQLFEKLKDERAIADRNSKLVQGSQTAMRIASKEKFTLPTATQVGQGALVGAGLETANILAHGYPGVGTALLATMKGGNAAKDAVKLALAKEHNARYAKYALPTEEDRQALIEALKARITPPGNNSIVRKGIHTLSRLVQP